MFDKPCKRRLMSRSPLKNMASAVDDNILRVQWLNIAIGIRQVMCASQVGEEREPKLCDNDGIQRGCRMGAEDSTPSQAPLLMFKMHRLQEITKVQGSTWDRFAQVGYQAGLVMIMGYLEATQQLHVHGQTSTHLRYGDSEVLDVCVLVDM